MPPMITATTLLFLSSPPTIATTLSSSSLPMGTTTTTFKPSLYSSFLRPNRTHSLPAVPRQWPRSRGPSGTVVAYMERNPNSLSGMASKLMGSLPVVGLVARLLSDEGGLGDDLVDFAEFRRRVGKKCGINDSKAFYEFQERRGQEGDPLFVLLCCWLTAVGAGLLKSEEILEGAARLRLSKDTEFEEQTFLASMTAAKERRAKMNAKVAEIPMELRAEKALEAIYVCSFGEDLIDEEEARLLCVMLNAVFPSVGQASIDRMVRDKVKQTTEGVRTKIPQPKSITKEAIQSQMKDLQFLKQKSEKST